MQDLPGAKEQALAYSHEGDLVGSWYEAALPNRQAFCMRDVAHHAKGAEALGLREHTKNMLLKFAQGIAQSRQFCSFWEIDKDYRPCPVDYASDEDFWYNLPANFDVLDACYRMYQMTGDKDYLYQSDFVRFYQMTVEEYADWWDRDGDGLLERRVVDSRLGIPSYCEDDSSMRAQALVDLLAIEIRGYRSAEAIFRCRGDEMRSRRCGQTADHLAELLCGQWWDEEKQSFYQIKDEAGVLRHSQEADHAMGMGISLCYYEAILDRKMLLAQLDALDGTEREDIIVERLSHYPTLFYRNGQQERGEKWLRELISPGLHRREYPEVSYAAVESFIYDMAGVKPDGTKAQIEIVPCLPEGVKWFTVKNLPFLQGEIDIHWKEDKLCVANHTGSTITVNGNRLKAQEVGEWKHR